MRYLAAMPAAVALLVLAPAAAQLTFEAASVKPAEEIAAGAPTMPVRPSPASSPAAAAARVPAAFTTAKASHAC